MCLSSPVSSCRRANKAEAAAAAASPKTYSTVINLSVLSPVPLVRPSLVIYLFFPFSFPASVLQFCTIKLPEKRAYLLGASRLYVVELGYALPALRCAV